jgi:omega-6 fatty acid desaturase (delta-12 desaturase)
MWLSLPHLNTSWKFSDHRHHISHASMERDEVYVPKTRSDLGIPPPGTDFVYDIFGDTPIFTLLMLLGQQILAFPAYLCSSKLPSPLSWLMRAKTPVFNASGQNHYPKWTNHFTCS